MRKLTILVFLVTSLSIVSLAGGYQVGLHGQKQVGMGLVGTSLTFDASCMFYNPGGLTFIKPNYSFALGVSGINAFTAYSKLSPSKTMAETENPLGTPFYFYGAARITDKISAGIAVNTPYGNGLSWGKDWVGRYLIQDLSLRAIFYQPTFSYQINEKLGVGAGIVFATGKFEMNKALPLYDSEGDGSVNLEGSTNNFGFNAGALFKPINKLSLGINYRSAIKMKIDDATATFDVPASLRGNFPNTTVATELPLPANLDFGVSYEINEKWLVALSLNYVFWGSYDSLIFDFADNTPALADSRNPRLYSDKMIVRLGAQYQMNDKYQFRVGGYYDPSPVNSDYFSPETPSLNSVGITAGLTYKPIENLALDLSFLFISGQEGDRSYLPDNFSGTYKTYTYIPGLGLTFNF